MSACRNTMIYSLDLKENSEANCSEVWGSSVSRGPLGAFL